MALCDVTPCLGSFGCSTLRVVEIREAQPELGIISVKNRDTSLP